MKNTITANNSTFSIDRDGIVSVFPTPHFTMMDLVLVGEMAIATAKRKKIKIPRMTNKWWKIPTLNQVA